MSDYNSPEKLSLFIDKLQQSSLLLRNILSRIPLQWASSWIFAPSSLSFHWWIISRIHRFSVQTLFCFRDKSAIFARSQYTLFSESLFTCIPSSKHQHRSIVPVPSPHRNSNLYYQPLSGLQSRFTFLVSLSSGGIVRQWQCSSTVIANREKWCFTTISFCTLSL